MSGFEWFLLIVVVIVVPLVVAVAVTLWTLEQARMRNRQNREGTGTSGEPVKRRATRDPAPASAGAESGVATERTGGDDPHGDGSPDGDSVKAPA